jgi:oligoribonuclease
MTLQLDLGPNAGVQGLLWCDLETTGVEEDLDEIIEIGALITDFDFNVLGPRFSRIVEPSERALGRLMKNPTIRKMHTDNGLLDEILSSGNAKGPLRAEMDMHSWMDDVINLKTRKGPVDKYRFMLAGSGVGHFDKRFIKTYLPRIDKLLAFPILDVGVVRRFLRFSGVQFPAAPEANNKNHRALDDIELHLEEARFYKERLREEFVLS